VFIASRNSQAKTSIKKAPVKQQRIERANHLLEVVRRLHQAFLSLVVARFRDDDVFSIDGDGDVIAVADVGVVAPSLIARSEC
jgi:hypothetical protein